MHIQFEKASVKYAKSFGKAVDAVARERKYLAAVTGFPEDSTLEFVENIVKNNLSQYYALVSDTVIGWCDILPRKEEISKHVGVLGIGVIKAYRGQGIGKKLLQLAIQHAKDVNALEKVELRVYACNTVARRLYEKEGFILEGERIDSFKLDGRYDSIILMGMKL